MWDYRLLTCRSCKCGKKWQKQKLQDVENVDVVLPSYYSEQVNALLTHQNGIKLIKLHGEYKKHECYAKHNIYR